MFKQISIALSLCLLTFSALSKHVAIYPNGPRAKDISGSHHRVVVEVESEEASVHEVKEALGERLGVRPEKIQVLTQKDGILSDRTFIDTLQQQYLFKILP